MDVHCGRKPWNMDTNRRIRLSGIGNLESRYDHQWSDGNKDDNHKWFWNRAREFRQRGRTVHSARMPSYSLRFECRRCDDRCLKQHRGECHSGIRDLESES